MPKVSNMLSFRSTKKIVIDSDLVREVFSRLIQYTPQAMYYIIHITTFQLQLDNCERKQFRTRS